MAISTRNAARIRLGIRLGRLWMEDPRLVSGINWERAREVEPLLFESFKRTIELYNQMDDLRRVVRGN